MQQHGPSCETFLSHPLHRTSGRVGAAVSPPIRSLLYHSNVLTGTLFRIFPDPVGIFSVIQSSSVQNLMSSGSLRNPGSLDREKKMALIPALPLPCQPWDCSKSLILRSLSLQAPTPCKGAFLCLHHWHIIKCFEQMN